MKNQKGFTLIEILIAMSVITLIAMAFFTFLNSSIKFNAKNENDIKALNIAQSEVENIREQIKIGKKSNFRTLNNEEINLNRDTPEYEVFSTRGKEKYIMKIDLSTEDKKQNSLYTIEINIKAKNQNFSKRSTNLITQVFGGK